MGKLDGQVIVVAGAGGIGDGLAQRYVEDGARVVVGDIDADHAAALAQRIDPTGQRIVATRLDGGDDASVAAIVALAQERFGKLTGFHANFTGGQDSARPEGLDIPLEIFDEVIRLNLRGYMLCSRHAVPAIVAAGGGAMVYTSSTTAYTSNEVRYAYSISKAGILALMRNVAGTYGPQGVRANAIAPGFITHPKIVAKLPGVEKMAMARAAIPLRPGLPSDIAALGSLLLSDEGSYITGQVIAVDAGITMRP